jgi:hypothetical protein
MSASDGTEGNDTLGAFGAVTVIVGSTGTVGRLIVGAFGTTGKSIVASALVNGAVPTTGATGFNRVGRLGATKVGGVITAFELIGVGAVGRVYAGVVASVGGTRDASFSRS